MDRHYHHALRHNASGVGKSDAWEVLYGTLLIEESYNVVQERPYKKVYHAGYLRIMLMWVGVGLATVIGLRQQS